MTGKRITICVNIGGPLAIAMIIITPNRMLTRYIFPNRKILRRTIVHRLFPYRSLSGKYRWLWRNSTLSGPAPKHVIIDRDEDGEITTRLLQKNKAPRVCLKFWLLRTENRSTWKNHRYWRSFKSIWSKVSARWYEDHLGILWHKCVCQFEMENATDKQRNLYSLLSVSSLETQLIFPR